MSDMYCVYMHRNKINNKKYIGITKQKPEDRWRHGLGYKSQQKFYRAIEKYGRDNFDHIILNTGLSAEEAGTQEQILISLLDTYYNGYNSDLGGSITNHSEATLEKMMKSMLGKKHTEKTKQKLHDKANKVSVICVELNKVFDSVAEASHFTGIDRSSISKCCRNKMLTAGGYTWKFADKELAKQYEVKKTNKCIKAVYCITTDIQYNSVAEAAKQTGCDSSGIIKVCKGKQKTTKGLTWKYVEDEE